MIPELGDEELTTALGRTPTRREPVGTGETIWFGTDRALLAELAVPGTSARAVFDGLHRAAADTGRARLLIDDAAVRAMVLPGAAPGTEQAVAGSDESVLTLVLPRGFPAQAAEAAARLLADRLGDASRA